VRVAVIGAGAVGLASAYALARGGAEVVVLERGRVGEGASFGNTGWICPSLSAPLAAPGVMGAAILGMARRNSPVLVQPRLDRAFLRWTWEFWRACSAARYREVTEETVAFGARSFELFDRLREEIGVDVHMTGMVVAARTERGLREYADAVETAQNAGYDGPVEELGADELRRREPALSEAAVGGLFVADERYVRPEELTARLAAALREGGAAVREGAEVTSLGRRDGAWRLRAGDEEVQADAVVLAAGAWSGRLLRSLGIRIPMEAAKGYSVTARGSGTPPRHALYLAEAKVGASPFGDLVRLAGNFDLAGVDSTLRKRRIGAILRSALPFLRDWRPERIELQWAGLRPYTADGLPIVGPVPGHPGLVTATGHGRMGITQAPSTAEFVRTLVLEREVPSEVRPLGIERLLR
jgi:D-amino-acid dehydrogenase